jgi:arylsulfatase A-like enzyme
MKKLSRRDFLKTASLFSLAAMTSSSWFPFQSFKRQDSRPNVILMIFDAMTARDLSLYGFRRQTTPNFERFAERATVFHNHTSGGNYTTPGTATILTGTYPWTHRAINQGGLILRKHVTHNLFSAFDPSYRKFAFAQNLWADYLISQFEKDVDVHLLPGSFSLTDKSWGRFFPNDLDASSRALDDFLFKTNDMPGSLLLGPLEKQLFLYRLARTSDKGYSRGLPHDVTNPKYFRVEDVFNGISAQLQELNASAPFLAYAHFYTPHEPYRPRSEFENRFDDNWRADPKPVSRFTDGSTENNLQTRRVNYDEYIANVDFEFGKMMDNLSAQGVLDNTIVMVTSDHGQLFERGIHGHTTPLLFDPVIHVPLFVLLPGQTTRQDVYMPTSNTDLVPTLLHLTGQPVPEWCEGVVLPTLGGVDDAQRPVFSVEAKSNSAFAPLKKTTISMRRGPHKLIYYSGYSGDPWFELYDMDADFEELNDLYPSAPSFAANLREELLTALDQSNRAL